MCTRAAARPPARVARRLRARRYRSRDAPDKIIVKLTAKPAFLSAEADRMDLQLRLNSDWLLRQDRACNLADPRRGRVFVAREPRVHPRRTHPHLEEIPSEGAGKCVCRGAHCVCVLRSCDRGLRANRYGPYKYIHTQFESDFDESMFERDPHTLSIFSQQQQIKLLFSAVHRTVVKLQKVRGGRSCGACLSRWSGLRPAGGRLGADGE